jgi:hypothetical protein
MLQETNYEEEVSLLKSQMAQTQRHQVTENIQTIRLQRENKLKVMLARSFKNTELLDWRM